MIGRDGAGTWAKLSSVFSGKAPMIYNQHVYGLVHNPGARRFRRGEHGGLVRGLRGGARALPDKRLQQRRGSTGGSD